MDKSFNICHHASPGYFLQRNVQAILEKFSRDYLKDLLKESEGKLQGEPQEQS